MAKQLSTNLSKNTSKGGPDYVQTCTDLSREFPSTALIVHKICRKSSATKKGKEYDPTLALTSSTSRPRHLPKIMVELVDKAQDPKDLRSRLVIANKCVVHQRKKDLLLET
eukprot:5619071-Amphidinium_carterae.2